MDGNHNCYTIVHPLLMTIFDDHYCRHRLQKHLHLPSSLPPLSLPRHFLPQIHTNEQDPASATMCCFGKVCMFCSCLVLVAVAIGLLFGFGIFKDGFHKIKDKVDFCDGDLCGRGRPFFAAPPRRF
ncbi:hypothetical protein SDJN03_09954, partial [Cucurbita argyrosperma subsp. sororia]